MLLTKQEILRYGLIEKKKDKMDKYVNCRDCPEFDTCYEKVDCADWKTAIEDPIHDYTYVPGPWAEKCIRIKKEIEVKMTNAEKFEEVFGIKIEENYPAGICQAISHDICEQNICSEECPAYKFWDREYKKPTKSCTDDQRRNKMKIYVVTEGAYSDYHICAVFDDKKKAELYCAVREEKDFLDNKCYVFGDEYIIEEYDTDDVNIEGTVYYGVRAVIYEGVADLFNDYVTFRFVSPIIDKVIDAKRYCRDSMVKKNCTIYEYAIDELTYNYLKDDSFAIRDYIKERINK